MTDLWPTTPDHMEEVALLLARQGLHNAAATVRSASTKLNAGDGHKLYCDSLERDYWNLTAKYRALETDRDYWRSNSAHPRGEGK